MSQEIENDAGEMITVYTQEEVEAQATERANKIAAGKDAEIEKLKRVNAEKTENFRKYNEMTEEERAAHSSNELTLIQRSDKLEAELAAEKAARLEREQKEADRVKSSALKTFHNDSPEVKEKLETSYAALAGMPESTPEEITARAQAAARLAGFSIDSRNPLYQSVSGDAPVYKETKNFTDTPEGREAADLSRQALGLPVSNA